MFLEESRENLQSLNENLLELEKQPSNINTINEIFRVAHTLKGMAATMGFTGMSNLTHKMENILELFKSKQLNINSEIITLLFQCLDMLSMMVEDIEEGNVEEHDTSELVERLHMFSIVKDELAITSTESTKLETMKFDDYEWTVIKNAKERKYSIYQIFVNLAKDCLIKSARAFLVIKNLEEKGEIIKTLPIIEKIEEEEFDSSFQLVFITKESPEAIKKIITGVAEIEDAIVQPLSIDNNYKASIEEQSQQIFTNKSKINQSVRVDIHRLDNFMNLVSELVINRTRLEQISNDHMLMDLHETLEQVARITTDLQDLVLKIRMLPIERVFNRFPRMVRDLSKELGKDIELVIQGQDTELDRTVVDELGDPFVHLIRNAVDHGIESKDERIKKGKDPQGIIKMIASQEGNKAIIRIEDDGKGIDPEVIRQKAVEKEIKVDGLNEEEIINLIFNQGFSTNDEVTDISGRGVGMDVVKRKISALGGNISVKSEVGLGSTFIIHLPLTLSIIQALLIKVATETFAISLGFIEKVISILPQDIKSSHSGQVFIYREQAIPVIRVNEKLNLPAVKNLEQYLIIIKVGEKLYGLIVDSLIGQQEIVIKPLGKSLINVNEYVGATILGNGLVTLILDPGAII
jgi:two-component system chemotaxis sensor kinase CheA